MNTITFIPARGGSKSIPKKNIKELGGKPLIFYTIEASQKCGLRTIVNTDSSEIGELVESIGVEVMMRPSNLAQDKTSMFEVLKSEIFKIEPLPDLVLLLQPTSPFRETIHIKTAIAYLTENLDEYDSVISVEKVPEKYNPAQMIVSDNDQKRMVVGKIKSWFKKPKLILSGIPISKRITRRQDFPETWLPTGSIYLFKTSNLKKGSIYGDKILLMETSGEININTQEDWDEAENKLLTNNLKNE